MEKTSSQIEEQIMIELAEEAKNRGITPSDLIKKLLRDDTSFRVKKDTSKGPITVVPMGIRPFQGGDHVRLKHKVHTTKKNGIYRYHMEGGHVLYEVRTVFRSPDELLGGFGSKYGSWFYNKKGKRFVFIQSGHDVEYTSVGLTNLLNQYEQI